jgi:D-amino-acid dehydrogenase
MKVAVLGGGVIGVTTAYYLQQSGHDVVVYDRQRSVGMETSFANAGQVSWGYASPWAAPGVPLKALAWLFDPHAPLVLRRPLDPALWPWACAFLRNCTAARYAANKARILRLARFSQECLAALRRETGIAYDDLQLGTLQLFRDPAAMEQAKRDAEILRGLDVPHRLLDREACIAVEPALERVAERIVGGLHLPGDETGDCHKFTVELARVLEARGVTFRMSAPISAINVDREGVTGIVVDGEAATADAYVVALGSHSARLLRKAGLRIPVYPVKGYSATLPISDANAAPRSTIMDERHKVAVTRLGDRIRAAGIAELGGYDLAMAPPQCRTVRHVIEDLFPQAGPIEEISYWTGLRAMTPSGVPLVTGTRYENLFINTGHGTLGWTMACGSGHIVANLVSQRASTSSVSRLRLALAAARSVC